MLLIRRILFPTDFSPPAEQALTPALLLAERFDAELHILHAIVLHADDPYNPAHHFPSREELLERLEGLASTAMAELTKPHRDRPLKIHESRWRGVSAAQVILDYAAENDIDLIVIGTHGRRGAGRLLLGSVTEEVVRLARCAVLTQRVLAEPREAGAARRVLVPIDFSTHSRQLVACAKELAALHGARLHALHIVEAHPYPYFYPLVVGEPITQRLAEVEREAGEALERLLAEVGGPAVPTETHVTTGHPASQILAFAREQKSDLIVIATHGLTGVERLLLGSTAEQVVRAAGCPVFIVKAHGKPLAAPAEAAG